MEKCSTGDTTRTRATIPTNTTPTSTQATTPTNKATSPESKFQLTATVTSSRRTATARKSMLVQRTRTGVMAVTRVMVTRTMATTMATTMETTNIDDDRDDVD